MDPMGMNMKESLSLQCLKSYQASETFSASKRATGGQLAKVISNNVLRNPKETQASMDR